MVPLPYMSNNLQGLSQLVHGLIYKYCRYSVFAKALDCVYSQLKDANQSWPIVIKQDTTILCSVGMNMGVGVNVSSEMHMLVIWSPHHSDHCQCGIHHPAPEMYRISENSLFQAYQIASAWLALIICLYRLPLSQGFCFNAQRFANTNLLFDVRQAPQRHGQRAQGVAAALGGRVAGGGGLVHDVLTAQRSTPVIRDWTSRQNKTCCIIIIIIITVGTLWTGN